MRAGKRTRRRRGGGGEGGVAVRRGVESFYGVVSQSYEVQLRR